MEIRFSPEFREKVGSFEMLLIEADGVVNAPTPDGLWDELTRAGDSLRRELAMADINKRGAIAATRTAYKACGKEPNRYRPSAEALCRRIVKGMDLYRSTALVDLINLLSVVSGHSIGGFDADAIDGPTLTLGVGREGEDFDAIGRGKLNIAGLPVYRDLTGGIGTPTSDNERTKLTSATTRLLMTVNIYGKGEMNNDEFIATTRRLLAAYGGEPQLEWRKVVM